MQQLTTVTVDFVQATVYHRTKRDTANYLNAQDMQPYCEKTK